MTCVVELAAAEPEAHRRVKGLKDGMSGIPTIVDELSLEQQS